jgi:hypothetical protein
LTKSGDSADAHIRNRQATWRDLAEYEKREEQEAMDEACNADRVGFLRVHGLRRVALISDRFSGGLEGLLFAFAF